MWWYIWFTICFWLALQDSSTYWWSRWNPVPAFIKPCLVGAQPQRGAVCSLAGQRGRVTFESLSPPCFDTNPGNQYAQPEESSSYSIFCIPHQQWCTAPGSWDRKLSLLSCCSYSYPKPEALERSMENAYWTYPGEASNSCGKSSEVIIARSGMFWVNVFLTTGSHTI